MAAVRRVYPKGRRGLADGDGEEGGGSVGIRLRTALGSAVRMVVVVMI